MNYFRSLNYTNIKDSDSPENCVKDLLLIKITES